MKMKIPYLFILLCVFSSALFGQVRKKTPVFPGLTAINEADLKKDIFELAANSFRGRRTGTTDELRGAAWVAQKAMEAGLKPAGDDGTYFQFLSLHRTRVGENSVFSVNEQKLALWKDVFEPVPIAAHLHGAITWLSSLADTNTNLKGKMVALKIEAPKPLPYAAYSLWSYRYIQLAVRQMHDALRKKEVSAIILVADSIASSALKEAAGHNFKDGTYQLESAPVTPGAIRTPLFVVTGNVEPELKKQGAAINADIEVMSYLYPTVNVVATAAGTDPILKNEYVLYSGHHDHDGVWQSPGRDSIYNGADDNASVTVAMLAIGRAWVKYPGKRSALFVWHGAEERGLLGSKYYALHPTVKKEAIVAVLNGDMIGRNSIDSAALLGVIPPHRNSKLLVSLAMQANEQLTHFKVDTTWDQADHPERWYFRSDHLSYAQAGIPAIMYSSLLHHDYHTVRDIPESISVPKLYKMTKWMYATGWLVSQSDQKIVVDK
jgi:hypothetical protein